MSPIRSEFKTYNVKVEPIKKPTPQEYQSIGFLSGLITDASPEAIPDNALQNMLNGAYVRNQLFRRNGLQSYILAKPDILPVTGIFSFNDPTTGINLIRFTATTVNRAGTTGWTNFTGPALASTNADPYSFTVADDRYFFANNGANVIQELNPGANTYAALGNAPQYRYITSAFNRVIGANLRGGSAVPYQIGWSGDINYSQWDPSVDISAGFTPLVNSPSDESDNITGVLSLESVLCIPRQQSIWLATNLPSATNPFNFFVAVPRIGCDVPTTIAVNAQGLIFYNFQTSSVYVYIPGDIPREISGPVKRAIKSVISDPNQLFASYNYDTNTYSLFITSSSSSTVKCFSYSFESKTWTYAEFYNISYVKDVNYATSGLTISQLVGNILGLAGTIDQLSGPVSIASRFFGSNTGDLYTQPFFSGDKNTVSSIALNDAGLAFGCSFDSKTLSISGFDQLIKFGQWQITPYTTGNITVSYSKDNGNTFTAYKTVAIDNTMLYKSKIILANRLLRLRDYIWRVSSSDCMFSLDDYYINAEKAGVSRK